MAGMTRFSAGMAAFALLLLPAFAGAADAASAQAGAAVAEPAGWTLAEASGACAMERGFILEGAALSLQIAQYEPGDRFEVRFIGAPVAPFVDRAAGPVSLTLGPRYRLQLASAFGRILPGDRAMFTFTLGLSGLERLGKGGEGWPGTLALQRGDASLRLSPLDFAPVTAQLRACSRDRLAALGLDPDTQANLSRAARPVDEARLFDTIRSALVRAPGVVETRFQVRAKIDAQGRASECSVLSILGDLFYAETVCRKIEKARFVPALDAAGSPVASTYAVDQRLVLALRP